MSFAFPQYVQVKDNYCCCYLGNNADYIVQLKLLRPQMEKQLPGLRIYIACKDSLTYLLEGEHLVVPLSQIEEQRSNFAYIREIICNNQTQHPIHQLMLESNLEITPISCEPTRKVGIAILAPEGLMPTQSLTANQVDRVYEMLKRQGIRPMILGSDINASLNLKIRPPGKEKLNYLKEASLVIGVENEYTFLARTIGAEANLLSTGVGAELFKKMYPDAKVITKIQ